MILPTVIMGAVAIVQCERTTWFPFKALQHSEYTYGDVCKFDLDKPWG
jgi:hypothetical protein